MSEGKVIPVEDYEHSAAKRTNNPPAGLAHLDRDETPVKTLSYDPHLDPQLIWAGKAERTEVEVPAPSIHVHEELSAQKIIDSVRRQRTQQPLFEVDQLDPAKAVEFYQHDLGWSNRMILGDSLMVMSSLLERERMAGKVQCAYIDPPYGIKYNSNFQPRITDTDLRHGRDEDLTREPEMIQAYRDTWELGVHSYLTYLRDRVQVVRNLLSDSGSLFVQIGDENVHVVRSVLDEIFGASNLVSQISFKKTSSSTGRNLGGVADYLLWYANDASQVRYHQLYLTKDLATADSYGRVLLLDGSLRPLTPEERFGFADLPKGARICTTSDLKSQSIGRVKGEGAASWFKVSLNGAEFDPGPRARWKTNEEGMARLVAAGRVVQAGSTLRYLRFFDDFDGVDLNNFWEDTGFSEERKYVVQTNPKVVARALLMTTDPGDLVLDPTCGGGTTALVAEEFGRRWITIDTSRVALAVARERLLSAVFPFYTLQDELRGVDSGFRYRQRERVSLGTIAKGEEPEQVIFVDSPLVDRHKTRVTGPFTVEALSRYAQHPVEATEKRSEISGHVETLLASLKAQGVPRPGGSPLKIDTLTALAVAGPLQAEGVITRADGKPTRVAVSLGPQFGAITMTQVADALRHAIGFDMVVFAGFAVSADAQEKLAEGHLGSTDVALLMANPDLLVGDLLKNTTASQTFRLYVAPDVRLDRHDDGFRVTVEGVDSFDAATGDVVSFGKAGIQAWFLDDDFDGAVFRVSQAFFPVTDAWSRLQAALRGTIDAELLGEMHGWTSLPFGRGPYGKVAIRVIADDGNASETILEFPEDDE